jgi:hypothetical protein
LGDKPAARDSYRTYLDPAAVNESSIPLRQHPPGELSALLADAKRQRTRAEPPARDLHAAYAKRNSYASG